MEAIEVVEQVETVSKFHVCPACKSDVSVDGREIRKVGETRTDHFVPVSEYNDMVSRFEKQIEGLQEAATEPEKTAVVSVPELGGKFPAVKGPRVKFRL